MQTNLETLSTLERRINMAVPAEEINKEIAERLKKLSRTTRMAGFRPGSTDKGSRASRRKRNPITMTGSVRRPQQAAKRDGRQATLKAR